MKTPLITLTTDFGLTDSCVASVKAVIAGICPNARVIDITHLIPAFSVKSGSFQLGTCFSYFPKWTIHVCVVDPGVGSARLPILVETENYFFVGPDNGLVTLMALRDGMKAIIRLDRGKYHATKVSPTFHGRDIFAPVAAHLARGVKVKDLGTPMTECRYLDCYLPREVKGGLRGGILSIDRFGNATTNISEGRFKNFVGKKDFVISLGKKKLHKLHNTFSQVAIGEPVLIVGSSGFVEFALNQGSLAQKWRVKEGEGVSVHCR